MLPQREPVAGPSAWPSNGVGSTLSTGMRTLGIDFGERRIGVAVSDPEGRFALPLETVRRTSDREAIEHLAGLCTREGVQRLVVGRPRHLDGRESAASRRTASFARKLAAATGLECELVDEGLTSVEAGRRLREAGVDPRAEPARLDAVAAQILLQDALDERLRRLP